MKREIHYLTKDEDLRQELWVYCLNTNSIFHLREYLNKLIQEQEKHKDLINALIKES